MRRGSCWWEADASVQAKVGCSANTLNNWVKKAEVDSGRRAGIPNDMAERMKALKRENREFRQANEILHKASAYPANPGRFRARFCRQFAQADERYTAWVEPLYDKVACRVAILWGEKDLWLPIERGRRHNKALPQSSFDHLAGLGHLPELENPAVTYKVLSEQ